MLKVSLLLLILTLELAVVNGYNLTGNFSKINESINGFWKSSKYVEYKNGKYLFNPEYTIGWIKDFYPEADISDEGIARIFYESQYYFEKAREDYEYCEELFGFREDNSAYIKLKKSALIGASQSTLEHIYESSGNEVLRKYAEFSVGREIRTKKEGNKTKKYFYYYVKTNKGVVESISLDMLDSDDFYIKMFPLYIAKPELFFVSIDLKKSWDSCKDYSFHMETAFENLDNSIIGEVQNANDEVLEMYSLYNELDYYGFCDESYSGEGKELCINTENFLYSVENGLDSEYYKIGKGIEEYEDGNLSGALEAIRKAEEIKTRRINLSLEIDRIKKEAMERIEAGDYIIKEKISKIEEIDEDLEKNGLLQIDIGFSENGISSRIKSIKEEYVELREKFEKIKEEIEKVDEWKLSKEHGWLAKSEEIIRNNIREVDDVYYEYKDEMRKAEESVLAFREMVVEAINELKEKGVDVEYEEKMIEEGDERELLKDKFSYYKEAWISAYAKLVSFETGEYDAYEKMKTIVEQLLKKAEEDEIDVAVEKEMFERYKADSNLSRALSGLREIRRSVIAKAELKYAELQLMRDEIEGYIERAKGGLDYIRDELAVYEAGIVRNGIINYEKGIGKLKELMKKYREILEKINKMREKVSTLESYSISNFEYVEDEEEELSVVIRIHNPNPFVLENKVVEVFVPFEPEKALEWNECKAKVLINNIEPYETKVLEFSRKLRPVEINYNKNKVYGENGKAYIDEGISIKSRVCAEGIILEKEYKKISGDGFLLVGKNKVIGKITPGYYYLEGERVKESGYEINKRNVKMENGILSYELAIEPYEDFDHIDLNIPEEAEIITGKRILRKGNILRVYDIDENTIINVSQRIEDEEGEAEKIIEYLNSTNLTEEERETLEEILDENTSNLEELIELKDSVEERMDELEKSRKYLISLREEMNKEIEELETGIECSNKTNTSEMLELYEERVEELMNYLEKLGEGDPDVIYSIKQNYDKRWLEKTHKSIVSRIMKEFAAKYKEYKKIGVYDEQIEEYAEKINELFNYYSMDPENAENICRIFTNEEEIKKRLRDLKENKEIIEKENEEKIEEEMEKASNKLENYRMNYIELEEMMKQSTKEPEKIKKEIERIKEKLESGKLNTRTGIEKIKSLEKDIEYYLDKMRVFAETEYQMAMLEYEKNKNKINEEERKIIEEALKKVSNHIKNKEYGKAARISRNIISNIESVNRGNEWVDKNTIILILLGAVLGFFYIKDKYPELFWKKEKKLRKLSRGISLKKRVEENEED